MAMAAAPVKRLLYGVAPSQPVRAVLWLCAYEKLPIELKVTIPPKHTRTPEFQKLNPRGKIPVLVEDDFALAEGPAIACYLAESQGWDALYPAGDHRARARVNEALSWTASELRPASTGVCMSALRADIVVSDARAAYLREDLGAKCGVLETLLDAHDGYVAAGAVTLADFFAYCELGQLRLGFGENPRTGEVLWDFGAFPRIERWLDDMAALPAHDATHAPLLDYAAKLRADAGR